MTELVEYQVALINPETGRFDDELTPPKVDEAVEHVDDIAENIEGLLEGKLNVADSLSDVASPTAARQNIGAAPLSHQHQQSDVLGLSSALAAKADLVNGVVPTSQIPREAMGDSVVVEDEAEMLALTPEQVQPGDIAIRQDGAGTFILRDTDPSVLGSWVRLNSPTDAVTSVNGQIGDVTLGAADVGAVTPGQLSTAINGVQIEADGFAELAAGSAAAAADSATAAANARADAITARNGAEQAAQTAAADTTTAVEHLITDAQTVLTQTAAQVRADHDEVKVWRDDAMEAAVDIATSVSAVAALPVFDSVAGEYDPASLAAWMLRKRDGQIYGVQIPKGLATACTKTAANAGIANPTPGVIGTPAVDPYRDKGPFFYREVNGYVTPDGVPHVTAFAGDATFSRTGSNGDVWILAPNLFWRFSDDGADSVTISISDVRRPGFEVQPKGKLPNGQRRPYMLYAKYMLSIVDGTAQSISGQPPASRNVSHDSLITQCKNATTGYSGKSYADDWYMKVMFLLKYATKNSQSVFAGCASLSQQIAPAVAESNVTRVIVTTAQAAQFPIGSAVMLGSNVPTSTDRAVAQLYNIISTAKILSKEAVGANTALNLNLAAPITTATTQLLSTAPWWTGSCDAVEGDGSPTAPVGGRDPFVIQGIELGLGMQEILGDVILSSDGATGWLANLLPDSRNAATSVTGAYRATGKGIPTDTADSWKYPLCPSRAGDGLLMGAGQGGSTSTGMCDGLYSNKASTTGTRVWRSLGSLDYGSAAGLWCISGDSSLGVTGWIIGSRLSANGRAS